jgi:hypothetical protein
MSTPIPPRLRTKPSTRGAACAVTSRILPSLSAGA